MEIVLATWHKFSSDGILHAFNNCFRSNNLEDNMLWKKVALMITVLLISKNTCDKFE